MYSDRREYYEQIEEARQSKILCYVTGDRRNLETQIHSEAVEILTNHLERIGETQRISLLLYTRGGETMAARSISNLIRQYCNEYEVIVPSKAHSAGTLICLGSNRIIMTKQATLGPIDPSINTPLNPPIPIPSQSPNFMPVSVEAINGFIDLAKNAGVQDSCDIVQIISTLSTHVHPLVLGQVYRTRNQIRMVGKDLLSHQSLDPSNVSKVLDFLCSESGSHDYTIFGKEAKTFGLNVEEADNTLYPLIQNVYKDIVKQLDLTTPYEPSFYIDNASEKRYEFDRALIESVNGGYDVFSSEGILQRIKGNPFAPGLPPQDLINDQKTSEGWKHGEL